jgi:hypothetical protein
MPQLPSRSCHPKTTTSGKSDRAWLRGNLGSPHMNLKFLSNNNTLGKCWRAANDDDHEDDEEHYLYAMLILLWFRRSMRFLKSGHIEI